MKDPKLTVEEKQLLKEVEAGEWKSVKNLEKVKEEMAAAAAYTLAKMKKKNINIRISEMDLLKLKTKAEEEGLPYQTLVASILHKYVRT